MKRTIIRPCPYVVVPDLGLQEISIMLHFFLSLMDLQEKKIVRSIYLQNGFF